MAIKRYAGDRFVGLSTDTKPTELLVGAMFLETDTGKVFFYDGSAWEETAGGGSVDTAANYSWTGTHQFFDNAPIIRTGANNAVVVFQRNTGSTRTLVTADLSANEVRSITLPQSDGVIALRRTAGDSAPGTVLYNGTTKTAGQFYGGATVPSNATRLNYDGIFYATAFSAAEMQASAYEGGTANFSMLTSYGELRLFQGVLSITNTGTLNNYNPGGNVSWIRWSGISGLTLTGVTGGVDGRVLVISQNQVTPTLIIANNNAGSTAANRFETGTGVDLALSPTGMGSLVGRAATFIYNGSISRWQLVSVPP